MSIAQWEETSSISMDRLRQCLGEGKSAVIDDTFSRRFLRDRCKAVALEFGAEFTIVFVDTPIEGIRSRRAANHQRPTRHHVRDDTSRTTTEPFNSPRQRSLLCVSWKGSICSLGSPKKLLGCRPLVAQGHRAGVRSGPAEAEGTYAVAPKAQGTRKDDHLRTLFAFERLDGNLRCLGARPRTRGAPRLSDRRSGPAEFGSLI